MDDDDVRNLITDLSLDYKITNENLEIQLVLNRFGWRQNVDTIYIPLIDLKLALDNI